ncbi:hypothetical protein ABCT75_004039 [Citrobacter freundii]|nr:hypothetical protein R5O97_06150 [Citrobacter freundii]
MIGNDVVLAQLVDSGKLDEFLEVIDPQGFDEFSRSVLLSLKSAVQSIEKNSDKYYSLNEEQLSTTISLLIERAGFKTKNEPSVRGHVDIFVEKDNFSWLIEAKIGYDNQKIFEGLLQLASRYLTNQTSACLLLYFRQSDIKTSFQSWKDFLQKKEWVTYARKHDILDKCMFSFNSSQVTSDALCFGYSFLSDIKTTAGEDVNIYHVGANLHYSPFDSSGRNGTQLKKAQAKIYLEHLYKTRDSGDVVDMTKLYQEINNYFEFDKEQKERKTIKNRAGKKASKPAKHKSVTKTES